MDDGSPVAGAGAVAIDLSVAPLETHQTRVKPEYLDYNGHMNVAYYVLVFDEATDVLFDIVGLDDAHRQRNHVTTFGLEGHINYLQELKPEAPIRITTQLLDYDHKRIHYFHRMYHAEEGFLSATTELISMHIDTHIRRSSPMADSVIERLESLMQVHRDLERPEQAGRVIGIKHR